MPLERALGGIAAAALEAEARFPPAHNDFLNAAERARKAIDTAGAGEPGKQASGGLRMPEGGSRRAETPNSQQAVEQTMSDKLLGYSAQQGGAEKRETTTVKGVY